MDNIFDEYSKKRAGEKAASLPIDTKSDTDSNPSIFAGLPISPIAPGAQPAPHDTKTTVDEPSIFDNLNRGPRRTTQPEPLPLSPPRPFRRLVYAACLICLAALLGVYLWHPQRKKFDNPADAMMAGDFATAALLLTIDNSPTARFQLGCLYKNGLGVPKNSDEAVFLVKEAADGGSALAQTMLGVWYASGDGVEANPATAVVWWRDAVAQGDANAAELLGLAYVGGEGVAQDNATAYMWFTVAHKLGNSDADSQRDLIGNMLESALREKAEKDAHDEFERDLGGKNE